MNHILSRHVGALGLFLVAFLACTLFGCSSPAARVPDGFRGVKWEAKASSVSGLRQVAGNGKLLLYEKTGDRLQMGDVKLNRVVYGFYKDRFYMGMAYFPSDGFKKIEEIMTRRLGQPVKVDNSPTNLIWDSDNVSVLLSQDGPNQGRLVYMYKPIQLEVELKK